MRGNPSVRRTPEGFNRNVWEKYVKLHGLWLDLVNLSEEDWPLTHNTLEQFVKDCNEVWEEKLNQNWRPE